jgi:hypothetical protein
LAIGAIARRVYRKHYRRPWNAGARDLWLLGKIHDAGATDGVDRQIAAATGGLPPEDRSDRCESFSRPEIMGEEGSSDEATQAHAGAGDPQAAGG